MQNTMKIPVGVTAISNLMEMKPSEIKFWDKFQEVRNLLKDYNYGVLSKDSLIDKLYDVSVRCANDKIYHYSTGIDNLISSIKLSY